MQSIIVMDNPDEWIFKRPSHIEIISAKDYLTEKTYLNHTNVRIFNFCQSQRYQSIGYYVSLIAQARGQKAIPSISTVQDLNSPTLIKVFYEEMNELIQKTLTHIKSDEFTLSVYFGKNLSPHYDRLCRKLCSLFQTPLLRAHFVFEKKWKLQSVKTISIAEIPENHLATSTIFAEEYFNKKRFPHSPRHPTLYSLAILINPKEATPPSNEKALKLFTSAATHLGFNVEFITKDDFNRLPEFDALLIRETTCVNHHTYRFARRALSDGLVVIDDPDSILKCANKIYLTEILQKAKIDTPKSIIIQKINVEKIKNEIGFPCVLKIPDGSFSKGVVKVETEEKLASTLKKLFSSSDLILAQEYSPSEFDWRIGVFNKTPLFASKYYMAKGHWQIYDWASQEADPSGDFETLPLDEVPEKVIKTALKAANLIGDGLYGVDLKQAGDRVMIIEVNDNPNIDHGVEDKVLGEQLYHQIIKVMLQRLHEKKSKAEKLL